MFPFSELVPNTGTTHRGETSAAASLLGYSVSMLIRSTSLTYNSKPDCSVRIHGSRKQRRDYLKPVDFVDFQAKFFVFWFMYVRVCMCRYVYMYVVRMYMYYVRM
jgi:hypothetical protein